MLPNTPPASAGDNDICSVFEARRANTADDTYEPPAYMGLQGGQNR